MEVVTLDTALVLAQQLDRIAPTKKAKKAACSAILNAHDVPHTLDHLEQLTVLAVAARHPRAEQKFGSGMVRVVIGLGDRGGRCFYLHREDGSTTDFSFYKAIDNPNRRREVMVACRRAVQQQVDEFRDTQFDAGVPICPLSGWPLAREDSHVHHARHNFDALVEDWVQDWRGMEAVAESLDHSDNQFGARLVGDMLTSWQAYHAAHAVLQLVHWAANQAEENARRERGRG